MVCRVLRVAGASWIVDPEPVGLAFGTRSAPRTLIAER